MDKIRLNKSAESSQNSGNSSPVFSESNGVIPLDDIDKSTSTPLTVGKTKKDESKQEKVWKGTLPIDEKRMLNILSFLTQADICVAAQVCKDFKSIAESDKLWKGIVVSILKSNRRTSDIKTMASTHPTLYDDCEQNGWKKAWAQFQRPRVIPMSEYSFIDLVIIIFATLTTADIFTDVFLVAIFIQMKRWIWVGCSLPFLILCPILLLYMHSRARSKMSIFEVIMSFLQLRIVWEAVKYYEYKQKERRLAGKSLEEFGWQLYEIQENKDERKENVILVKVFESFFESLPQAYFQMYLVVGVDNNLDNILTLAIASIFLSLISLSLGLTTLTIGGRQHESAKPNRFATFWFTFSGLGYRLYAFAIFGGTLGFWIFLAFFVIFLLNLIMVSFLQEVQHGFYKFLPLLAFSSALAPLTSNPLRGNWILYNTSIFVVNITSSIILCAWVTIIMAQKEAITTINTSLLIVVVVLMVTHVITFVILSKGKINTLTTPSNL